MDRDLGVLPDGADRLRDGLQSDGNAHQILAGPLSGLTVILLAGDRGEHDAVASAAGVARKSLAEISGQPMLAHTLANLRDSGVVGRIIVVANQCFALKESTGVHAAAEGGDVSFVEGAGSPISSVLKVMDDYPDLCPVLLATADTPLTTAGTIAAFTELGAAADADLAVGLVTRATVEARFAAPGRTFIPLKGAAFTGCNLFLLKNPTALKVVHFWLDIEKNRKKALGLVAAFGFWTLLKVIFRMIDIDAAMARVSKVTGATIEAIVLDDPLAAMDVDKPQHLDLAREILGAAGDVRDSSDA